MYKDIVKKRLNIFMTFLIVSENMN